MIIFCTELSLVFRFTPKDLEKKAVTITMPNNPHKIIIREKLLTWLSGTASKNT
jgi:hypothetical protein